MSEFLEFFWQFNIEFSLLLIATLIARFAIRKTTRIYNAYLLWLSIPLGLLGALLVSQIDFSSPSVVSVSTAVQSYVVAPVNSTDSWAILGYFWVAIAALLLLRLIHQHRALRQDLKRIGTGEPLAIHSRYPLVAIQKSDFSPAVYGFFKPAIYFPVHLLEELSQDQVALIIRHEEHHITQQHLWLNLLWDILVCLMWFNPFVYVSRQSFRHDQELFCDYLVLNKSDRRNQKSYGLALLSTVTATHSVSLLCSWKTFNQLEERIMNITKPSSFSSTVLLSLFGAAIVAFTSLYAVAGDDAAKHKHKKVIKIVKDDGESRDIKVVKDGKTYIEENGERFVVEGDNKRAMSKDEAKTFEKAVAEAQKHVHMSGDGMHKKKIKIMRGSEHGDLSDEELMEMAYEMANVEMEIERAHSEIGRAQHEVEMALKEIEAAHASDEISAKAMEKARKQLEKTREQLERDQAQMQRSLKRAREDIERARSSLKDTK